MQHIKWAVSLVIAYGHFSLPQEFVRVCMVNTLTLSPLKMHTNRAIRVEIIMSAHAYKHRAKTLLYGVTIAITRQ